MRPDPRTTPSAVNSTPPLSARIEALEPELDVPHRRQPGQMEVREDRSRRARSGGTSLLPTNVEDTSQACLGGSATDRAGTRR